jgi:hypothetical protein
MRCVRFWYIMQRKMVFRTDVSEQGFRPILKGQTVQEKSYFVPKRRYGNTSPRYVESQNSAHLILPACLFKSSSSQ